MEICNLNYAQDPGNAGGGQVRALQATPGAVSFCLVFVSRPWKWVFGVDVQRLSNLFGKEWESGHKQAGPKLEMDWTRPKTK